MTFQGSTHFQAIRTPKDKSTEQNDFTTEHNEKCTKQNVTTTVYNDK